ncbi:carbon-nitrogen family hydrolase [Cytobacillus gottheilii]|uniref:carbon-nitrogen family hydrolase n=1 Tax=Cytobacillus gottheilii TaxID=859144 RepID=UPI0009B94A0B|nr:carbon-nitrogen family hydrolase [Cytobacillus gottheilii]
MKLTISCLQMDVSFGDPKKNFDTAHNMIIDACKAGTDVIVLPELWTTGYDLENLYQHGNIQEVITFLQEAAVKYNIHIIGGSAANLAGQDIYNSMPIIARNGQHIHTYSKLHLFKLMDEHLYLKSGRESGLFSLEGRTFAGVICYDIRFPEWIRKHVLEGAEILFVSAEWPLKRLDHWRALLIARAIENQCFIVACNRSGHDPNNKFAGHSMIIDPWGQIIKEAGSGEEILQAEVDLNQVLQIRNTIPIFTDRKPDFY